MRFDFFHDILHLVIGNYQCFHPQTKNAVAGAANQSRIETFLANGLKTFFIDLKPASTIALELLQ